ncbi:hypothetical protein BDV95DRAFT_373983 [Massariosphaeria phaeospora]|uniref:WSC domain-containing protein n=1 Tax=Massariosphaeria phaeospora TaxID=100035 RepID=A0A7C8I878_9PLEO|nr:hypothetical protein BDV95DRAFT_373983 [Massariosphaeria phaeospora]
MGRIFRDVLTSSAFLSVVAAERGSKSLDLRGQLVQPAINPYPRWGYVGCYSDDADRHTLRDYYNPTTNNVESSQFLNDLGQNSAAYCIALCDQGGWPVAGVESGNECYCAFRIQTPGVLADEGSCDAECPGAAGEACGGTYRISVYTILNKALPSTYGWYDRGCYSNDPIQNTLYPEYNDPFSMGAAFCIERCAVRNYPFAATSGESCYCANTISPPVVPSTGCDQPCSGTAGGEVCGGTDRVTLYSTNPLLPAKDPHPGWYYVDCYTDDPNLRTFRDYPGWYPNGPYTWPSEATNILSANLSASTCIDYCDKRDFLFAGTQLDLCYCANNLQDGVPADNCNAECSGAPGEACGAVNRVTVYTKIQPASPADVGWHHEGCYTNDPLQPALGNNPYVSSAMDAHACISRCKLNPLTIYAGTVDGSCYCAQSISASGVQSTGCIQLCPGQAFGESCGGTGRIDIYSIDPPPVVPEPAVNPYPGWRYLGCYTDDPNLRTLRPYVDNGVQISDSDFNNFLTDNDAATCIQFCDQAGYSFAGTEKGFECWCASFLQNGTSTTGCDAECTGTPGEACGGNDRLTIYTNDKPFAYAQPQDPVPNGWRHLACVATDQVTLSYGFTTADNNAAWCTGTCAEFDFKFAVTRDRTCYCVTNVRDPLTTAGGCIYPCPATPSEACGGTDRFSLYALPAPPPQVCHVLS